MKMKNILGISLVVIFLCGCSSANDSMTKADSEFNGYASEAAEQCLQQEADHTRKDVKTGELEYRYTLYNEELDIYEVGYLAEFDEEGAEEQWLEICVTLAGSTKSVEDVSCAYWDAVSYEMNYDMSYSGRTDQYGKWKNINLLEEGD